MDREEEQNIKQDNTSLNTISFHTILIYLNYDGQSDGQKLQPEQRRIEIIRVIGNRARVRPLAR